MNLKKKIEVVMLPADRQDLSNIGMYIDTIKLVYNDHKTDIDRGVPQHLYFLSDEIFKYGDKHGYYYDHILSYKLEYFDGENGVGYKKIIASTNKSLKLPQPSPAFIQKYIEEWNKGNKIQYVMVDYEEIQGNCDCYYTKLCKAPEHIKTGELCRDEKHFKLKVDKNNNITVTKVKDSWSREEVKQLIEKSFTGIGTKNNCIEAVMQPNGLLTIYKLDKWIEDNL